MTQLLVQNNYVWKQMGRGWDCESEQAPSNKVSKEIRKKNVATIRAFLKVIFGEDQKRLIFVTWSYTGCPRKKLCKDEGPSFEVKKNTCAMKPTLLSQINSWLLNAVYFRQFESCNPEILLFSPRLVKIPIVPLFA